VWDRVRRPLPCRRYPWLRFTSSAPGRRLSVRSPWGFDRSQAGVAAPRRCSGSLCAHAAGVSSRATGRSRPHLSITGAAAGHGLPVGVGAHWARRVDLLSAASGGARRAQARGAPPAPSSGAPLALRLLRGSPPRGGAQRTSNRRIRGARPAGGQWCGGQVEETRTWPDLAAHAPGMGACICPSLRAREQAPRRGAQGR